MRGAGDGSCWEGPFVVLLLLVIGAGLAAFRYLPAVDEARLLRTDLEAMVDRVQEAGLEIDRETLDSSRPTRRFEDIA